MQSLLPDVFRFITIAGFAVLTGQVVAVLYFYLRANRLIRKVTEATPPRPGLLPKYVVLMTASFWSLAAEVTLLTVQRLGEGGLHPAVLIHPVVTVMAVAALWTVMRFERRRIVAVEPVHAYHLPNETLIVDDPKVTRRSRRRHRR